MRTFNCPGGFTTRCASFFLSVTVCNRFTSGVFSMIGAVNPDSFDILHSYSNTFQIPFVTPWFPEKVSALVYYTQAVTEILDCIKLRIQWMGTLLFECGARCDI